MRLITWLVFIHHHISAGHDQIRIFQDLKALKRVTLICGNIVKASRFTDMGDYAFAVLMRSHVNSVNRFLGQHRPWRGRNNIAVGKDIEGIFGYRRVSSVGTCYQHTHVIELIIAIKHSGGSQQDCSPA
jgi:hypothetical protein